LARVFGRGYRYRMRPRGLALLALLPVAGGCGSDPATPPAPPADAGKEPAAALCAESPGYVDLSYPALDVGKVTATVRTTDGEPAAEALVEVCGINVCTRPKYTDAAGEVVVSVEERTQKPALKYGDAYEYGEVAVLFAGDEGGTDFGTVYVPRLPVDGAPLLPGLRAESGGVAITLADKGRIELDAFAPYDTDEGRALRTAELPHDLWPAGLTAGAKLELVFTLAPMGAKLCPPAALELPNSEGWEPGTALEFSLQGLDAGVDSGAQLFAPYGEWEPFGTGIVDETGERLVVTDGALPVVANVGVRRL
jgi:hypothetical protein